MGFRNPFRHHARQGRRRVRERLLARLAGAAAVPRAVRHRPVRDRPQARELRLAALLQDRPPYYKWDFNTSTPLPSAAAPETHECDNPTRGPQNTSRWVASGGPTVEPGPRVRAADHEPRDLVLVPRQPGPPNGPQGTPCFASYGPSAPPDPGRRRARACSPSCSPAASGRTAPRRTTTTRPTRTRPSSRPTGTGPGSPASSRRTRCARSAWTRTTRSSRSTTRCRAARCRPPRRARGCATTRWTWSSGPTARSTCSPTATASSPSTRTPG